MSSWESNWGRNGPLAPPSEDKSVTCLVDLWSHLLTDRPLCVLQWFMSNINGKRMAEQISLNNHVNHSPPSVSSPLCLCRCCVVAAGASWFFALCWLWLSVTSDLSGSMEFHTWCVCDPPTSSCALILLAERLPVTYSKVPPVRIKRVRGRDSWKWGDGVRSAFYSVSTIPSFCTHSGRHEKKRGRGERWTGEFKRNRRRQTIFSRWLFCEMALSLLSDRWQVRSYFILFVSVLFKVTLSFKHMYIVALFRDPSNSLIWSVKYYYLFIRFFCDPSFFSSMKIGDLFI